MNAVTTIKTTGCRTLTLHDAKGELIATASKVLKRDSDYGFGMYRICIFGGPAHGKINYATDYQNLNDKSVEIAKLNS